MRSIRTRSTGKLYAELYPGNEISRDNFEEILGAMARAGLLSFADAVFEKEGKQIPYRTVSLTPAGRATNETTPVLFVMKDAPRPAIQTQARQEGGEIQRCLEPPPLRHNRGRKKEQRPVRFRSAPHRASIARMALE